MPTTPLLDRALDCVSSVTACLVGVAAWIAKGMLKKINRNNILIVFNMMAVFKDLFGIMPGSKSRSWVFLFDWNSGVLRENQPSYPPHPPPAFRDENLVWVEAGLVGHLATLLDPVAQIDPR